MKGYLILLLHAHLPFVRHPEYEYCLEENWLFESIRETYIPLLDALECMVNDRIRPNLTISISPTLAEMLNDDLLRKRFIRYMDNLIELSESEKRRTRRSAFEPLAFLYSNKFKQIKKLYLERYKQDLISAFRRLQEEGHIEIVATAATHAFLPSFEKYPWVVRAQIDIGIRSYIRNFGTQPSGFWLPESGYYRGLDLLLKDAGIKYSFLESHGIICGIPRSRYSVYKPVLSPRGLMVFGRDFKSARQVWCASGGYPGEPSYRDFYRDVGFDLPTDYIRRFTHFGTIRTFTGMKYHSITGATEDKLPYNRVDAMRKVLEHALHFTNTMETEFRHLLAFNFRPVVFSAFDAELFGHWWFEGVEWLNTLVRNTCERDLSFQLATAAECFSYYRNIAETVDPSPSSWGEGGYNSSWISEKNHHLYRHLHRLAERMEALKGWTNRVLEQCGIEGKKLLQRAVNQAMREMLLAQASDWLFLINKGRTQEYAEREVRRRISRFNIICSIIESDRITEEYLREMEESDTAFKWVDIFSGG